MESSVKASLALVLNSLMEKERDEYINAPPHERTENRNGLRNGYYSSTVVFKVLVLISAIKGAAYKGFSRT